jgi:hypothetical protein
MLLIEICIKIIFYFLTKNYISNKKQLFKSYITFKQTQILNPLTSILVFDPKFMIKIEVGLTKTSIFDFLKTIH